MSQERSIALTLAKEAGIIIRKYFQSGFDVEIKSDGSPVTIADKSVNDLVLETLSKEYPDHQIIGEEGSKILPNAEYSWICDPIDGTIPFTMGIPISVFMLSLTHHGIPILGLIYDAYFDRMIIAEKGKGTFLNNQKIVIKEPEGNIFIEGPSPQSWAGTKLQESIFQKEFKYLHYYCCGFSTLLLTQSKISGTIYGGNAPWDGAAGKIIIEEAGGVVSDIQGNNQPYDRKINGFIFGTPKVHARLLKLLNTKN